MPAADVLGILLDVRFAAMRHFAFGQCSIHSRGAVRTLLLSTHDEAGPDAALPSRRGDSSTRSVPARTIHVGWPYIRAKRGLC